MGYKVPIYSRKEDNWVWRDMGGIEWIPPDEDSDGSVFWWTEGNFGCDCNRMLEYLRAQGRTEEEIAQIQIVCGHTEFFIPFIITEEGELVHIDKTELKKEDFLIHRRCE